MAEIDLAGLLHGRIDTVSSALDDTASHALGVTLGTVTAVGTGQNAGAVKLQLTMLSEDVETDWAPVITGWAGRTATRPRGAYLPPAVDDQALVAFRQGDPRRAYVLGFVWSEDAPAPETTEQSLQRHGLYGGEGNRIVLDDTPGAVKVEIRSAGGHRIELNDAGPNGPNVTVSMETGNQETQAAITLTSSGVTVATSGEVTIKGKTVTLDGQTVNIKNSSGQATVQAAAGALNIKGQPVRINC